MHHWVTQYRQIRIVIASEFDVEAKLQREACARWFWCLCRLFIAFVDFIGRGPYLSEYMYVCVFYVNQTVHVKQESAPSSIFHHAFI